MIFARDARGHIVQTDGDGGDTYHRDNLYWAARRLWDYLKLYYLPEAWDNCSPGHMENLLTDLEVENGVYTRHWDTTKPKFWTDPKDFTRDQWYAGIFNIIVQLKLSKDDWNRKNFKRRLDHMLKAQLKRLIFFQNGDLMWKKEWALYARAYIAWNPWLTILLWPILLYGDVWHLLNSLWIVLVQDENDDNVDPDINHSIIIMACWICAPTPISWLAKKIYVKFRDRPFFRSDVPLNPNNVIVAWQWYFKPKSKANPFDILYQPILEEVMK